MNEQQYWNRSEGDLEDFEIQFFKENEIRTPVRIILSHALDPRARKTEGLHLEKELLSSGGCYLFFDSYQSANRSELLPLYVGRSNSLKNRLSKHWGNTENFIDEYQECIANQDERFVRTDADLLRAGKDKTFPTGLAWVAFWYENNDRERIFLEHELIYKCRPIYNRT